MKKKFAVVVLSLLCAFACVLGLVACSGVNNGTHAHTHNYVQKYDDTYHWNECSVSGCTEKIKDRAAHDTNGANGSCSVCGYKKNGTENPPEHQHTYSDKWTSAGADGHYHLANCEHAGEHTKVVPHVYDSDTDDTCNACGYVREVVIPHTHTLAHTAEKAAGCTTDGNSEYWYCSGCGKYFSDENGNTEIALEDTVITKLDHDLEHVDAQAPTCVSAGWDAYDYCKREDCGYTTKVEKPATGIHTGGMATCTSKAICEVCHNEYGEIDPDNHDIVHHNGQAATCTEDGWAAYETCSRCDYTTYSSISKLGHDFSTEFTIDKNPTCTENGSKSKHCSCCDGKTEVTAIMSPGHFWNNGSITKEATCTETGVKTYICFICYETKDEEIAMLEHTKGEVQEIVDSTCTKKGYTIYLCDVCGNTFNADYQPTLMHNYNEEWICKDCRHEYATDGIAYELSQDGTHYTVVGYTGNSAQVIIPAHYNNIPVTAVGVEAFKDKTYISSVFLSQLIQSVGYSAFEGCSSLTSITIPDSVTSIGDRAFYGCSKLRYNEYGNAYYLGNNTNNYAVLIKAKDATIASCNIHSNTKIIYYSAFQGCSNLTSITIESSIASIGGSAFYGCSKITSIAIPNKVTSIGDSAFCNCSSLTSITIGNGVTSIGHDVFNNCSKLESITAREENANYASQDGILYNKAKTKFIYIPKAIKGAIMIPSGITSIGDEAFRDCSGLTSIKIPDGVTSIGDRAFYGCSSLQYNEYENALYLGNNMNMYVALILAKNYSITSCTIHNNTNVIADNAFSNCSKITSIAIPNKVTSIGDYAFKGCSSLMSIEIPNGVTSIGGSAFYGCSSLTGIEIPSSVTSIGNNVFYGCSSLTSITIPDSVTSIGGGAFSYCSSLTSITIPDSVTSIEGWAFSYCIGLTSITIPDSVMSIGGSAFYGCSSLTSITIPNGVTRVAEQTFYNCTGLTSITIPNSVTSIGGSAFRGCSSLTSIEIPDSVTSIGGLAFWNCSSLTSITIPDSVTSIGDYAFSGCSKLTIYCEATEKPSGWDSSWSSSCPVVWGYKKS